MSTRVSVFARGLTKQVIGSTDEPISSYVTRHVFALTKSFTPSRSKEKNRRFANKVSKLFKDRLIDQISFFGKKEAVLFFAYLTSEPDDTRFLDRRIQIKVYEIKITRNGVGVREEIGIYFTDHTFQRFFDRTGKYDVSTLKEALREMFRWVSHTKEALYDDIEDKISMGLYSKHGFFLGNMHKLNDGHIVADVKTFVDRYKLDDLQAHLHETFSIVNEECVKKERFHSYVGSDTKLKTTNFLQDVYKTTNPFLSGCWEERQFGN